MRSDQCKLCRELTLFEHGNEKLCPKCKKVAKKSTSDARYARVCKQIDPYWQNEKALRENFHSKIVEPNYLETIGFEFNIFRETKIIDNETVFVMNKYGFSILKNKKIKIWKVN